MTTTDARRRHLSARFRLAEDPTTSFSRFTPLGERAWAHGWEPVFPAGGNGEPEPGLVFETTAHGGTTTWVVIDVEPGRRIRYARSRAGMQAGTVTVELEPDGDGTLVTVTYDLTALSEHGRHWLDEFAAGYGAEIAGWGDAIAGM